MTIDTVCSPAENTVVFLVGQIRHEGHPVEGFPEVALPLAYLSPQDSLNTLACFRLVVLFLFSLIVELEPAVENFGPRLQQMLFGVGLLDVFQDASLRLLDFLELRLDLVVDQRVDNLLPSFEAPLHIELCDCVSLFRHNLYELSHCLSLPLHFSLPLAKKDLLRDGGLLGEPLVQDKKAVLHPQFLHFPVVLFCSEGGSS